MAQTTLNITRIKERDIALMFDNIGDIFEGTTPITSSAFGTAAHKLTISAATGLVKAVASGTDTNVDTQLQSAGTGVVALGGTTTANASEQIVTVASAVNFLQVTGAIASSPVLVTATGTDATVDLLLQPKSTGVVALGGTTKANASLQVNATASSVNFLQVDGAAASAGPIITATGTDTNVALHIRTKGTGVLSLGGASAATAGIQVAATASAVNQMVVTNAATGQPLVVSTGGASSDANAAVLLTSAPAGTGSVYLGGSTLTTAGFEVARIASTVNHLLAVPSATGNPVILKVGGASVDANAPMLLIANGSGLVHLGGTTVTDSSVIVNTVASAVNKISFTPAATGNAPSIALGGQGADANRNLTIAAAGTGAVVFNNVLASKTSNTLTAVGTNRATALLLASDINNITSAAASTGVQLPVGIVGNSIFVNNAGANTIQVYAAGSETIDGTAGATGVALTNAKRCMYYFVAANTWISAQMGVVSA